MTGRPFALIGVNSDRDLATIRKTIEEKNLNWRSFQNQPESAETSISTEWAIRGWPTLIVIDETFQIRYRGHNGHEASELAVRLTAELETKQEKEEADGEGER